MRDSDFFSLEVGEWPGSTLSCMKCVYPDAPDGGFDIALPVVCEAHARTYWWCLNAGVVWCDGGPPEYNPHLLAEETFLRATAN